ncbi:hypothetical protein ACWCXB_30080 [Streptomyces sp. NPDC001514]
MSALLVLAISIAVLVLAHGVSVPEAWWPRAGEAFAASTEPGHQDPCDLIKGPARTYCVSDSTTAAADGQPSGGSPANWTLIPPAVALIGITLWRRHDAVVQRRR